MPAFIKQFPTIAVADAPENEKHDRSTIQGTYVIVCAVNNTSSELGTKNDW